MKNKGLASCLLVFSILALLVATFLGGLVVGSLLPRNALAQFLNNETRPITTTPTQVGGSDTDGVVPTEVIQANTPEELEELFKPFWESWDLLHKNYVDQPLDDLALMRGAIQGMLAATGDKHTSYMNH